MKKIIFMGTPEFSVPVLEMLIKNYNIIAVITQPDRHLGKKTSLPPIKEVALKNNIKVLQFNKIRNHTEEIKELNPDLIITCAYGQILPESILEIPKLGCINVHASVLPKLRGAAPIHRAIIEGHQETGVTIMYMDKGMDTGDIISIKKIQIEQTDTTSILHDKLSILGSELLKETLPSILEGNNNRTKQNSEEATYASMILREDELITFNKNAKEVYNQIRGLNSWPGAYFKLGNEIVKVWNSKMGKATGTTNKITNIYQDGFGIMCKDIELILTEVQPAGKRRMNAGDYARGINNHKELKTMVINYEE